MPVTIRRAHRDVLRRQVIAELRDIGEIHLMLDTGKGPLALGLRRRYEGYMRLLDDLGWREDDPGEEFAITTDPIVLMRVPWRL
ncbi:hypothetical protein Q7L65_06735 [Conexibacter sp. CPCC 206217]|nr:hypothetical protein [Conexibacter sp. CPCC 206217]MDO8210092.1 hypothetical protein [Conexibacter sp. CPCC 206217]